MGWKQKQLLPVAAARRTGKSRCQVMTLALVEISIGVAEIQVPSGD